MKFCNIRQFSPVVFGDDLPDRDDLFFTAPHLVTKELHKSGNYYVDIAWWDRQKDRCLNGYEVKNFVTKGGDFLIDGKDAIWYGDDVYIPRYDLLIKNNTYRISGRMYWYLNFWIIYGIIDYTRQIKGMMRPRFTALDFFFFRRMEMMFEQQKDGLEFKGRQEGFSEKMGGAVLGWNYSFIPASQNIVVGGEQADADKTFANTVSGLDNLKNTQFYKERSVNRLGEGGFIKAKNFLSEVHALTAKDKPQSLSRFSPTVVVYEEIGKGKREWSIKTSGFVSPSIMAEGIKTGWQFFIGTGGDMEEGGFDLEQYFYNPEKYNLLSFPNDFDKEKPINNDRVGHFTGKDWFDILDENGNPQIQKSRKHIDKIVAEADLKNRHLKKSQYAYYVSDALMSSLEGYFGQEIIELLSKRKTTILSDRSLQVTRMGRLVPKNPNNFWEGVDFVPDDEGWIEILEMPELDVDKKPFNGLYKGGTDSYDQDEAENSDSKGSMVVRKTFRQGSSSPHFVTPVALIIERPTTAEGGAELFYMHTILTCIFYNCRNNIEYSNLRIFEYYKNSGFHALLEERPQLAFAGKILDPKTQNQYGTDKSLKPHGLAILKDRLTPEYINNLYFIRILEALAKFRYKKNCDITMAMMEAEINAKEYEHQVVKSRQDQRSALKGLTVYVRQNGEIIQKTI